MRPIRNNYNNNPNPNRNSERTSEYRRPESNTSIPPAHILQGYEDVSPGATDKILEIVKKEQAHRQKIEAENLHLYHRSVRLGQYLAFALALLAFVYSKHLSDKGFSDIAIAIPVSLFVFYIFVAILNVINKNSGKKYARSNNHRYHKKREQRDK